MAAMRSTSRSVALRITRVLDGATTLIMPIADMALRGVGLLTKSSFHRPGFIESSGKGSIVAFTASCKIKRTTRSAAFGRSLHKTPEENEHSDKGTYSPSTHVDMYNSWVVRNRYRRTGINNLQINPPLRFSTIHHLLQHSLHHGGAFCCRSGPTRI